MKAKVIIENLETDIILTPENEFEKRLLEDMYDMKNKYNFFPSVDSEYSMGVVQNYSLKINIKEEQY